MPFFSGQVKNRQIIIDVLIGHPHNGDPSRLPNHLVGKPPYKALIDTGATNTCISPKIVDELKLIPEGKKQVFSATQQASVNLYHVSFCIPVSEIMEQGMKIDTHSISNMEVTEIMQPNNYDVLLGMDVIANCSLFIARDSFTLGY